MVWLIVKALYFFLPAYFANMAPVLFKKLPFLEIPIWENKLGKNKTWRGLVIATLMGVIIFSIQKLLHNSGLQSWAIIDYNDFSIFMGGALGLGAIIGDAVKSYYKRKAEIPPGKPWWGFDQLDFVFGGIIGGAFFYVPRVEIVTILIIFSPILHVLTNRIGYWLKIRDVKN
jgi:CDP-2,3-bis-(O-geranylgeranyl)-sn-glycerol synthase